MSIRTDSLLRNPHGVSLVPMRMDLRRRERLPSVVVNNRRLLPCETILFAKSCGNMTVTLLACANRCRERLLFAVVLLALRILGIIQFLFYRQYGAFCV